MKKLLFFLAVFTTVIYVIWRIFFSLPFHYRFVDMLFATALLIAEVIGFLEAINYLKGLSSSYVPPRPQIADTDYPEVDIFIATYNEEAELLKKTVWGCKNMDYPDKSKVHIYLCDDNDRKEIARLAKQMNVGYFRRDDHEGAKAGNLNHACKQTSSPLIATFDADMIPMHHFLTTLVPYFFLDSCSLENKVYADKPVGFVQSPQSFYNADLFQYNLYSENKVPNEQDFFFKKIQLGRNASNSAIYAGSNTILSRRALEEAGGFYMKAITEDLATGLKIQEAGYLGFSVPEVLANGLAPTELKSLFKQRERWARGCLQTIRQLHVLGSRNLSLSQKINYLFSMIYWYMPLRRGIFILAPILFSLFGIYLLDCTIQEIILFWLPHYIFYNLAIRKLSGNIRNSRLSDIYDTILFPKLLTGILLETLGIQKREFEVTNKKRNGVSEDRFFKMAWPLLLLLALSAAGLLKCLYLSIINNSIAYLIIIFWLVINGYSLLMAILFTGRRMHIRQSERFQVNVPVEITYLCRSLRSIKAVTVNISEGGLAFFCKEPVYIPVDVTVDLKLWDEAKRYQTRIKGKIIHVAEIGGAWQYSVQFSELEERERYQLYGIVYDRVHTLPQTIARSSGYYSDLQNNFAARRRENMPSQRKLPRINLYTVTKTTLGHRVRILNYNYEYILIRGEKEILVPELTLCFGADILLQCRQTTGFQEEGQIFSNVLYEISNCHEIDYYSERFIGKLNDFRKEYELTVKNKRAEKNKHKEMELFDEMQWI